MSRITAIAGLAALVIGAPVAALLAVAGSGKKQSQRQAPATAKDLAASMGPKADRYWADSAEEAWVRSKYFGERWWTDPQFRQPTPAETKGPVESGKKADQWYNP